MKERSLGMMILLTIITLGIYQLYWAVAFQVELKKKTNEGYDGLPHLLLILFTFGIYYIYWTYKVGERLEMIGRPNNGVLYLILVLVTLGWLNPFLMQNEANQSLRLQTPQNKQIEV